MPVKLIMVGLTHSHSHGNARAAAMVDDVSLVGVYDADAELARRRCAEWAEFQPDLHLFASQQEALTAPDVQGVIVDGRVAENVALATLAVEHGKHVLLEKPAGLDREGLRRLQQQAAAAGRHVQLGYIMRYNAGFELAKRLYRAGALGDVFSVRGRISWEGASYDVLMPETGVLPGGVLFELGCHYVDMIAVLLGRPTSWHAHLACHHDRAQRYTDNAIGILEYPGAIATIESAAMESGALQNRSFEVYGTQGTVIIQPLEPPEVVLHLEAPWREYRAGWQSGQIVTSPRHVGDLQEFAACIEGRKQPTYPPEHDLMVQEVLLGMCADGR